MECQWNLIYEWGKLKWRMLVGQRSSTVQIFILILFHSNSTFQWKAKLIDGVNFCEWNQFVGGSAEMELLWVMGSAPLAPHHSIPILSEFPFRLCCSFCFLCSRQEEPQRVDLFFTKEKVKEWRKRLIDWVWRAGNL